LRPACAHSSHEGIVSVEVERMQREAARAGNRLDVSAYRCVDVVGRNRKNAPRPSFPVVSGCHPAVPGSTPSGCDGSISTDKILGCPTGKTRQVWGNICRQNIPLYRNSEMAYVSRQPGPWKRGVSRSSRRGPGGGGRGPHRRDGLYRAGNREQRPRANDRCDPRTAKSCGPGARSLCVKARGDVRCPTGRAHQSSARRRGQ